MATQIITKGLDDGEQGLLNALYARIEEVAESNVLRDAYYDNEVVVKGLGLDKRPDASIVRSVLGWNRKSVDTLGARVVNEGLVIPGSDLDSFGIGDVWRDNRLDVEAPQIEASALIHSVGFLVTSLGDADAGEPEVLVSPKDANSGTGFWNARKRGLDSFLSVLSATGDGKPLSFALYLPRRIIVIGRPDSSSGFEVVDRLDSGLEYVPVEPLVYRARTGRPFGSSRISRAAMAHQDAALRTIIRSELAAEDYISPVRVLMNADLDQFRNSDGTPNAAWYALSQSKTVALPEKRVDVGGDEDRIVSPSFQMVPGADMSPFSDHLEMWAALFAAETSLPQSQLGIRTASQPVSAEAILADYDSLIIEADRACRDFAPAYARVAQTAWRLKNPGRDLPDEVARISTKYRDPRTPSRGAMSDEVFKQVTAGILPAESEVTLERLGYGPVDIARIQADRRLSNGRRALDRLAPVPLPR